MAITVSEPITPTLYIPQPGQDSPWPVGHWRASRTQAGDATGGSLTITMAPNSVIESAKWAWSIEGISCVKSGVVGDLPISFVWQTAEPYTDSGGGVNLLLFEVSLYLWFDVARNQANTSATSLLLPRYIARPKPPLTTTFLFQTTNIAGQTFRAVAWGYIWHQQVFTNAGGPRRL